MIVFGWGGGKPKDMGPAMPFVCSRCERPGFARYFTVTKWFRLYFIPVMPYQTKQFLVCPTCMAAHELTTSSERARAARLVSLTASLQSGTLSEDAYQAAVGAELSGQSQPAIAQPAKPALAVPSAPPRPDRADVAVAALNSGNAWSSKS